MKQCLGHGQWVVRWVPQLYDGYGYPVFNFYPPLFYFLGALIANLGANIVMATNLSLFIAIFLSSCTMYLFARELWGKEGGFISAIAYLFAPYHIVDLYLRGAAAETMSFVFLPLILWSFYKLKQTPLKRYKALSALSSGCLLLTHNGISMIFFPLIPIYILLLYWPYSYSRLTSLLQSFWALALGVGLAAFFWLPALVEKKFVHTELLTQGNEDFHKNFAYFKDLFSPLWGNTMPYFGESHTYCQIGLVHCLVALIVLMGFNKIIRQNPSLKKQILFFVIVLIGAIFFTLPYSILIWEHIHTLQYLQFPWRFLTIAVLAISVIAGGIVLLIQQKHQLKLAFIVVLAVFLANFFYCHPRDSFICELHLAKSNPDLYLSQLCLQDGGEYIPIWANKGVKGLPGGMPLKKLQAFLKKDQIIDSKEISPLHYKFRVQAQGYQSFLCFNSFYFPGWVVKVDNKEINIIKDNGFGYIVFQCPTGVHDVDIYFGTTQVRQIAQGISIVSLALLALVLLF